MATTITVGPASPDDFAALSRMDLAYDSGRVLALKRTGTESEPTFAFEWRNSAPSTAPYNEYPESRLRDALPRVDLFLAARAGTMPCGLLMLMLPSWTNAGEITDLAVDRAQRRSGAGRALVEAAVAFARARSLRALWVEPRADNAAAIEFYLSLGFRISGFNDRMYTNDDHEDGRTTLLMHLGLA